MAAEYEVIFKDPEGVQLLPPVRDFISMSYQKVVNDAGVAQIVLHADHDVVSLLEFDCQVEIWRRDVANDVDWYMDFDGLFVDDNYQTDEGGTTYVTLVCPGVLSLLSRVIVAYPSGVEGKSLFSSSSAQSSTTAWRAWGRQAIQAAVYWNAAIELHPTAYPLRVMYHFNIANSQAHGTAYNDFPNPRRRLYNDTYARLRVYSGSPTYTTGTAFAYDCAFRNVLEVCQELARMSDQTFELTKNSLDNLPLAADWDDTWFGTVGYNTNNKAQWTFTVENAYSSGSDYNKTNDVIFAPELGNMASPRLARGRLNSKTDVLAGGEGVGESRILTASNNQFSVHTRQAETFVSATQATSTSQVISQSEIARKQLTARAEIDFDPRQTSSCLYGRDYVLKDRVTARYRGITAIKRIQAVTINVDNRGDTQQEQVQIRTEDEDAA